MLPMTESAKTDALAVQGEFATGLALRKCHEEYDLPRAVSILTACMDPGWLTESERLLLAIRILDGTYELRGPCPGPHALYQIPGKPERPTVAGTLARMRDEIAAGRRETDRLRQELASRDGELEALRKELAGRRTTEAREAPAPARRKPDPVPPSGRPGQAVPLGGCGWLEPSGAFHPARKDQLEDMASRFVSDRGWTVEWAMSPDTSPGAFGGYLVHGRGWILVLDEGRGPASAACSRSVPLTRAQKDFLCGYYLASGYPDMAFGYLDI